MSSKPSAVERTLPLFAELEVTLSGQPADRHGPAMVEFTVGGLTLNLTVDDTRALIERLKKQLELIA